MLKVRGYQSLQNKNQVKTASTKTNFFQIYPNKQTVSKVNARF